MELHPGYSHDLPATEDALGREHLRFLAGILAHSLVLPDNSPELVVGIEGKWVSGMSTLIGSITKNLRENNTPVVIEFSSCF